MHSPKVHAAADVVSLVPAAEPDTFSAADLWRFIRLRRWSVAIPIGLALLGATTFDRFSIPMYEARAQIIIDPRLPQFIPGRNEESVLAWDTAQVESEIAVIQSERIAGGVVSRLRLEKANDFRRPPPFVTRLIAWLTGRELVRSVEKDRYRAALELIETGLNVRRTGLSYAIDITYTCPDPLRATEIANGIAEVYISDQIENRSQAARLGGDWLQQRMVSLRSQMNNASKAVQVFRASHNYQIARPRGGASTEASAAADEPTAATAEAQSLDELEASAATYRRIYESFLQSYTESVQRQSFPVSDARLLTSASLPESRSWPRTNLIYGLAVLLGSLVGFGTAIGLQHLDRTVRGPRQITALGNPAPVELGRLPRPGRLPFDVLERLRQLFARGGSRPAPASRDQIRRHVPRGRWLGSGRGYFLAALDRPDARFARAMLAVKTMVDLARRQDGIRCIGVTATHKRAGASMLASNLGSLAAECGTRTLVVDADLRMQTLTCCGGTAGRVGLAQVLTGAASIENAIVPFAGTNLAFLPAGGRSTRSDACLLAGEAVGKLMRELTARYDFVIFDLPPMLPAGSVVALATHLDAVILAVQCGRTTVAMSATAIGYLDRAKAPLLGFVLTEAEA